MIIPTLSAALIIIAALAAIFAIRTRRLEHDVLAKNQALDQLELLLGHSHAIVILLDKNLNALYIHDRHSTEVGLETGHTVETAGEWLASLTNMVAAEALTELQLGRRWQGELNLGAPSSETIMAVSATPLRGETGFLDKIVVQLENVTDRHELSNRLYLEENFNAVTGLPNRRYALKNLSERISRCSAGNCDFAVMHIDLDRIRYINDAHGYQLVDQLFADAADRLRRCVREGQLLAHLGADEFLIIFDEDSCTEETSIVADVVLEQLRTPFHIRDKDIRITASVGLSHYPSDGNSAASLLRRAEIAMYEAKRQGGNRFHHFEAGLNGQLAQRIAIESQLRNALERDELALHFQPQIAGRGGELCTAEVLLRWQNSELGNPGPDTFIPVAEESDLIFYIGDWVLQQACKQAMSWRRAGLPAINVAINVSARQFEDRAIVASVRQALKQSGLPAAQLELEVTEGLLMNDSADILESIEELKQMGVQLSLDDFGTGFASLSYLKRYPFDILKIDRHFIHDIETSPPSLALVNAIIAMAHSFDMKVVAEGVETEGQRKLLNNRGCDLHQGYLYSKPLPREEFGEWMRQESRRHLNASQA